MIKNYKTLIINKSNILPLVICLIFLVLQFNIIDYGTNINNIDYISNYKISDPDILEKSDTFTLADEKNIVASPSGIKESKDKWYMRFNLYTVQPEENANIKALARIKNDPKNFDPAFYAYGGAYLYSLGAWYFIIDKIGIIDIKSFHELLKVPDNMDEIYISGRFFVLLLFTLSGLVLFYTISKIANSTYASLCLILYLATPISLLYSVVLKPHFYALFWCNLSLLILCNSLNTKYLSSSMIALLGICVGMAVGSVITFSLFSLFVGFVLIFFYKRSYVSFNKLSLFIIVALATFIATNPYIIVNYEGFALERSAMKDWFFLSFEPIYLIRFIKNSILPGIGFITGTFFLLLFAKHIFSGRDFNSKLIPLFLLSCIFFIAVITPSISTWHINYRLIPYFLPIALIYFAYTYPNKIKLLFLMTILTIFQSIPMHLAFIDENNPDNSTRIQASNWINNNIALGENICLVSETLSPHEIPPFNFNLFKINESNCSYYVTIEPSPGYLPHMDNYKLEKRWKPRFFSKSFPTVYGYINPQISVYKSTIL